MKSKVIETNSDFDSEVELAIKLRDLSEDLEMQIKTVDDAIRNIELNLICVAQNGFDQSDRFKVKVETLQQLEINWKAVFIAIAGSAAAQRVELETNPLTYKRLLIFHSPDDSIVERERQFRFPN